MENRAMLNFTSNGRGKTLVLVHGFLGGLGYWAPLTDELKHVFNVVAIDLPGFAGSSHAPAPDSIGGFATSVMELLERLQVQRFSMLGFSMGSMIAQQVALDFPDRIEKLVLYGSAAVGDLPHRFESWDQSIARIQSEGVESVADKTVATWFIDGENHFFYSTCREACRGAFGPSCISAIRAIQRWDNRANLAAIRAHTLIVVGDKDRSTKLCDSLALWNGLRSADLCVMPNCAHGAHMEKPELFNKVVRDFLAA